MFKFDDISDEEPNQDKFERAEFEIDAKEFLANRKTLKKPFVLDLRLKEDFELGHFPGAHHLPMEFFEERIYQIPFDADVMIYGSNNREALTAAELFYENGIDNFKFTNDYADLKAELEKGEFTLTPEASAKIHDELGGDHSKYFTIVIKPISHNFATFTYKIDAVEPTEKDYVRQVDGIHFKIDREGLTFLDGLIVSLVEGELKVSNPASEVPKLQGSADDKIRQLLASTINPMVASHGGVIDLLEVKENKVYLEFGGGCKGCGMVDVTLKQGVEVIIKENVPGIVEVLDVTDHANGTNPYYTPGK